MPSDSNSRISDSVKRRRFLASVGLTGAGLAAGCSTTGDQSQDGGAQTDTPDNDGDSDTGSDGADTESEPTEFVMGTSLQGTPVWNQGQAIQAVVREHGENITFSAQETKGFTANIDSLIEDVFNIGVTYTGLVDLAARGAGPFEEPRGEFAYFGPTIWAAEFFLVAREDSDIEYYKDIVDGGNIASFPSGSGSYTFMKLFLETIGIEEGDYRRRDIASSEFASAIDTGRVDVCGYFSFHRGQIIPSSIKEIEARADVRPLKVTEENWQKLQENPALTVDRIKFSGSEDFPDTDTAHFSLSADMMFDKELPAAPVAQLCNLLVEHTGDLQDAVSTFWDMSDGDNLTAGIHPDYAVHPGYEQVLRDNGWWNDDWKTA